MDDAFFESLLRHPMVPCIINCGASRARKGAAIAVVTAARKKADKHFR
ncbi:MAG: hypothetical protein IPJ07_10980 [Acidobacteria bacterium]|nr:hypothetical protein [Acidobacteriota bacterium]